MELQKYNKYVIVLNFKDFPRNEGFSLFNVLFQVSTFTLIFIKLYDIVMEIVWAGGFYEIINNKTWTNRLEHRR